MAKANAKGQMRRNQTILQAAKDETANEVAEKARVQAQAMEAGRKNTQAKSKVPTNKRNSKG